MDRLQTLVATMNQTDFSLVQKMNIRSDVILANQCDFEEIRTEAFAFGEQKMVSTTTRGVGINRNIALLASSADYLLFADDDITYNDDAFAQVIDAFRKNPRADLFVFSMDYTRNGEVVQTKHLQDKRLYLWNAMRYGTVALAVRREALNKNTIQFNQLFGGGCLFGSGEDSLFLRDCLKCGLRLYSSSYVLGRCSRDGSSWFRGYNDKYLYDKGALMGFLFPAMRHIMLLRFARTFARQAGVSYGYCVRWMLAGLRHGRQLISYDRFLSEKGIKT